jgi:hypothetical protein
MIKMKYIRRKWYKSNYKNNIGQKYKKKKRKNNNNGLFTCGLSRSLPFMMGQFSAHHRRLGHVQAHCFG